MIFTSPLVVLILHFGWPQLCISEPVRSDKFHAIRVSGTHGAVAAEATLCSQIGLDVLKENGTAVDASIASGICQGLIYPFSSGIGGGGLMLIRTPNHGVEFIDFRETAPLASNNKMYQKHSNSSIFGGLSVAVPGEIRGFELAHKRYGKLTWKRLFEPTIKLARYGHKVTHELEKRLKKYFGKPNLPAGFERFYTINGQPAKAGDILKNEALANTLEKIANHGGDAFYTGPIAQSMVNTVQKDGGILTMEDLINYQPRISLPLEGTYRGRTFYTSPTPSSGAALVFALNILENYDFNQQYNSTTAHIILEVLKYAFAQRAHLGDAYYVPVEQISLKMMDKTLGKKIKNKINENQTFEPEHYNLTEAVVNDHGTCHISVLDEEGMAVSMTTTINLEFGAQLFDFETGVLLNDEMDDFTFPSLKNKCARSSANPNSISPGKRPLSSMIPTIFESKDKSRTELVVGGSGGTKIFTAVLQMIINIYDFNMDVAQAVNAPRLHHQLLPNQVSLEPGFTPSAAKDLITKKHSVVVLNATNSNLNGIQITNSILTASDSRKNGTAAAY